MDSSSTPNSPTPVEPAESNQPTEPVTPAPKTGRFQRFKRWVRHHPKKTIAITAVALLVILGLVLGLTNLKYSVLGRIWKADVTVRVSDTSSKLPVAHAKVSLGGQENFTDKTGKVSFRNAQPGPTTVQISRVAYASLSQKQTLGFGDNDLGDMSLKATGISVAVHVTNVLSGADEAGVEVKAGDVQSATDSKGIAKLVFPPDSNNTSEELQYEKDGFNTLTAPAAIKTGSAAIQTRLLPSGKAYYLSNRSGKIDLYESNLDGSGANVVLAGTGNEDVQTGVLPNVHNSHYLALVSSREGRRDMYSTPIHDLFLFNTSSGTLTKLEDNVGFSNYRAWVGDVLVYERQATDGGCASLKQYNSVKTAGSTIVTPESAGGCPHLVAPYDDGFIYSVTGNSAESSGLFYATPSVKGKRISSTPSDSIVRRTKETLLSVYYYPTTVYAPTWQSIDLESFTATRVASGPSDAPSRAYADSPSDTHSVFIEERDGKSNLYLTDAEGKNEVALTQSGAVSQFVNWIGDDYVIFSVSKSDENALYVVSVKTRKVTKITDFYRANSRTYSGGNNTGY